MRSKSRLFAPLIAVIWCLFATTNISGQRTPNIDTEKTTTTQTISSEELNKLPGKRDVSKVLLNPDPGASGVINMSGGNSQTLAIEPASVKKDGTYTTGNTLTALSAGTFGVTVVVSVDKEKF